MEGFQAIVDRLPRRELDIRRCLARDASFKAICSDYEEAVRAREHWQQAATRGDSEGQRIAEDYNKLLVELEEEILAYLDRSRS
jgi:hypothetical protein